MLLLLLLMLLGAGAEVELTISLLSCWRYEPLCLLALLGQCTWKPRQRTRSLLLMILQWGMNVLG